MKLKQFIFALVALLSGFAFTANAQVAKVGNTEYATIDEAIANWTNGTTLTLLADVTLSDVIKLSSTEYHILDLGTYTMTAGVKKNSILGYTYETKLDAIEIVNNGRSKASYALDIKADATNPGGITASGKAVVKTTGKSGVQDRPIIRFYGGVFNGSNVVSHSGSNGTNCPQFCFYGGVFNGTISANRALIQFYGGTFNGKLNMSVDSSAYALIAGGRFKYLSNEARSDLNNNKFTIGSAKGVFDRSIYVDADGYYVVTSEVIKEVSAKYPAVKKEDYNKDLNRDGVSDIYFYYSAANTYGMFYEVASMAGTGSNVTVWEPVKAPAVEEIVKPEATEEEKAVVEEVIAEVTNNAAVKNNTVELPAEVVNFSIELAAVEVAEETTPEAPEAPVTVVTEISYTVTPSNAAGEKVSKPSEPITFRLPLPSNWASEKVKVIYNGTALDGDYTVMTENDAKYVEVESQSFSTYTVQAIVPLADYVVLPAGMDASNYETMFGANTVTDGTNYYATLQAAVEAVAGQANAVLYCKPGADVGSLQHAPVVSTLTVYGNGANVTGGSERDFDLGNTDPSGGKDITADMTLTVKHLNGCGAWGAKATEHTVNLVFENCANMGKVFITGTTGTLNITMNDCAFEGVLPEAVYSNADGAITLTNVAFSNLNKAVNLNHKAAGTQTVTISGCSFTDCGNDVAADQIPVRVVSSVKGGKSVLSVSNSTFSGTPAGGADVLLDYGVGVTEAAVENTSANVHYEQENNVPVKETVSAGNSYEFTTAKPVASINGTSYMTLAAAVETAQADDEIVLIADIELASVVTIPADKKFTLDLNGKTFTCGTDGYCIENNAGSTVTIKDTNGNGAVNGTIYNQGGSTMIIDGGTYNAIGKYALLNDAATMTINGGVINGKDSYPIYSYNDGHKLTINNVTVNGECGCINAYSAGEVIINDGTFNFTGREGYTYHIVYVSTGTTMTINGGTFKKVGDVDVNGEGGGGICANGTGKLFITGGTFDGAISDIDNYSSNTTIEVSGGNFSDNSAKKYVANGFELKQNADGTYGVVEAPTEVATLAELQAALADNSNELPIIITETIVIPQDETVVIDLNGKAISMEESIIATAYAINNLGTLTIKDTKGDGSINARGIYNGYGNGGANVASAKITVVNGTINAKGTNGGAAIFNYGIADIQGGNFTSIGGYSLNNQAGASMTIADGVTANNGIYASNATLVVDGGEINGNRSGCHVLYAWNSAVTINGGTFYNYNSGNSTIMSAGTSEVTINGGTISIKDGRVPGNGNTWTSCLTDAANTAKIIVNGGTFNGGVRVQGGATMTISGGSFNDVAGSGYNVYTGAIVEVKGGTFTDAAAQTFAKNNLADGYEMGADGAVAKKSIAAIGENKYESLEAAAAAAQSGDEIVMLADVTLAEALTLPAGITFNGNDKQITGIIVAAGDITFAGVTKAGDLDFAVGNTVVNIPAGASLQLNGSARMSIGFGTTFNIVGTIEDAKTADKATVVPSLVIPGASFSGAGVKFNVTNAYISVPSSYCSTSKSASGTFDFNITNSIWESAGKLAFESQSTAATVNFDLVNSVLTTGSHLVFGVSRGEVVVDNSNVNVGKSNQIENQSTLTIKNGSVVNGAVATSSNAKNPGTVIVENATYAVTGEFSGSDLGTGTLVIKNGANVSIGSITKANIVVDATDMTAGELANFTANLANFAGELSVINNDKLEAKIENGKIVLAAKPVAKIGEKAYATLAAAVAAVQEGETITILAGTISEGSIKLPAALKNVTIKGEEGAILKDMTITAADGNTVNYEGLTFDGITFDNSNVVLTGWRTGGVVYKNIKVNGCTFKNIVRTNNEAAFHINCDAAEAVNGFTFTNNVVDGVSGASNSAIYAQVTGEVVVSDNVINNVAFRPYVIQVTTNDGVADTFTVTGNTFSGSAAGRAQGLGSDAEGTDAVELVVSNNIFKDITNAQQICYWNFNAETTTADLSGNYYDIDILANPSRIYFNSAAADTNDLVAMGIFPIYTELNEDGTINENSAYYPPVVKMGGNGYQSVEEALAAAKAEGLTEVEITIVGKNTASTADSFDLVYTTLFDNVTIKQENGGVAYYINELYTGSRTNAGQFVFDGVNIVVTGQYMFEGNVKLSNNSLIKSVAEANCFVYNAEVTIEAGSKIDGVIEDIRGGSLIIDGGKTDGTYCEEPALRDAILIVNWASSNLVLKNGAYVKVNAADEVGRLTVNGTMDVSDSKLESYQYIAVNSGATLNLNAGSVITTKELTGAGTINVDATELNAEPATVIVGNLTGFTGTINVEGEGIITERTENGLVIKADPNYIKEHVIDDANSVDYTFTEEKFVGTLTYKRTLIAGIWNPLYLPFEISVEELVENYDIAYYNQMHSYDSNNDGAFDSYEMEVAYITRGTLRANYPYFIRPKNADACELEYVAEDVTLYPAVQKNIVTSSVANIFTLSGTHSAKSKDDLDGCYAISVDGEWTPSTTGIKAHRLYLKIEENDNSPFAATRAKAIRIVARGEGDGTTGIDGVEYESTDAIYDLTGRRVLETEKGGIYIINGKKVLVK